MYHYRDGKLHRCIEEKCQLTERTAYLNAMKEYQVASMVNTTCVAITDTDAYVETNGKKQFLEAATVIICVGTKPLETERDKFIDSAFDVINVEDCVKASSIVHAVHTGFNAGLTL